jgi:RimJ/RimL family protein N-acetyltransferase
MRPYDVWRNLELPNAPSVLLLRHTMRHGEVSPLFIRREEGSPPVGFILLYGELGARNDVEFDIAVPGAADRQRGVARSAVLALEDLVFGKGLARRLWAWIDEANKPCLELVRSCAWRVTRRVPDGLDCEDGRVDAVEVALTLAQWRRRSSAQKTP